MDKAEKLRNLNGVKIKIMQWVLAIGIILLCIKFFTYFLTRSNAILADAIESVVNVLAGGFALYSMNYALRPKDRSHPYGHGKIEFLSAGFEGGMILLAGLAMIIKGIVAFIEKDKVAEADVGAWLSAGTGLVNYFMGAYLVRKGKKYNSAIMIADGKHLVTDTVSSIGLVAGLLVIYFTQTYWIDYVITSVFGLLITYTGIKLIGESVTNLLDKADYGKLQDIINLLNKHRREKWIDVHNLRALKYGSRLHIDCHVTLPWYDTLEEAHEEVNKLENLVKENTDLEIEFFIHADPCLPACCPICPLQSCAHRKNDFVKKLDWTLGNVLPDKKHTLDNSAG